MTDNHNISFFGKKTGLIVTTTSVEKDAFMFLRMIKKLPNGNWEKKEGGKNIKISLREIVSIVDVLNHNKKTWNTFHSFKKNGEEIKTTISIAWDEYDSELLWINIGDYSRPLAYPDSEVFSLLMQHILEEKISKATVSKYKKQQ